MISIDKRKIIAYLDSKGFKHSQRGFQYIATAIELVSLDRNYLYGITKQLYPKIAQEFDTTASRVERAIRHSIETAGFFKNSKKLSNSEFIARAVDNLLYGGDE